MNSQFKFKPDKIKYLSTVDTLDSSHKKMINNIVKKKEDLPNQINRLEKLHEELQNIDSRVNEIPNYISLRAKIIEDIAFIEEEMKSIENYEEETEYYSKTHHILFNYYDILDGQIEKEINNSDNDIDKQENKESEQTCVKKDTKIVKNLHKDNEDNEDNKNNEENEDNEENKVNNKNEDEWNFDGVQIFSSMSNNTLDKLNEMSKSKRKEKKSTRKRIKNVESLVKDNNYNIFDFIDSKNNISNNTVSSESNQNNNKDDYDVKDRATLYEDYKTLLEGYSYKKNYSKICINCNIDKVLLYSEGIYACMKCGDVENCIVESESTNFKDPMIEKPTFPYKRKNHFCEWNFLYCSSKLLIKRVASFYHNFNVLLI